MENSKLICRAKKPFIMRNPYADNSIEFDRIEDRESDKTATRQLMFSFGGFEWWQPTIRIKKVIHQILESPTKEDREIAQQTG